MVESEGVSKENGNQFLPLDDRSAPGLGLGLAWEELFHLPEDIPSENSPGPPLLSKQPALLHASISCGEGASE